jgi:hypothetical protein
VVIRLLAALVRFRYLLAREAVATVEPWVLLLAKVPLILVVQCRSQVVAALWLVAAIYRSWQLILVLAVRAARSVWLRVLQHRVILVRFLSHQAFLRRVKLVEYIFLRVAGVVWLAVLSSLLRVKILRLHRLAAWSPCVEDEAAML